MYEFITTLGAFINKFSAILAMLFGIIQTAITINRWLNHPEGAWSL